MPQVPTFSDLQFSKRRFLPGIQARHAFPNGYEASVIQGFGTYGNEAGLYELAVMVDDHCVYDTPVTDDVLGSLTERGVTDALAQIAALPDRSQ